MARYLTRGGIGVFLVPVRMPVLDIPAVPAGTERNQQHWVIFHGTSCGNTDALIEASTPTKYLFIFG